MTRELERRTIHYSGQVQGVGFRWRVDRIVESAPGLSGYVRNLADGRVELVLEGPPAGLAATIARVRLELAAHIRNESSVTSPATGEYLGFRIRR